MIVAQLSLDFSEHQRSRKPYKKSSRLPVEFRIQDGQKKCRQCLGVFAVTDFNICSRNHDGRTTRCNDCMAEVNRGKSKRRAFRLLIGGSAKDCVPVEGVVYLLESGGIFKIGRSKKLGERLHKIRTDTPHPVFVIHTISTPHTLQAERYWHEVMKDRHFRGEWFELTPEDVGLFCSYTRMELDTLRALAQSLPKG